MITLATYSSWVFQPTWILFTQLGNVARARNPMTCAPGDLAWVQPHESSTHILRSGSRALLSETAEGSFCSSNLDNLCSACVRRSWGYTSLDMHGIKVHVLIVVVSRAYKIMTYLTFRGGARGLYPNYFHKAPRYSCNCCWLFLTCSEHTGLSKTKQHGSLGVSRPSHFSSTKGHQSKSPMSMAGISMG